MTGIVTDIQRFSLNDGPGIRTTIFFKGCNMKCAWCHNPEAISSKPMVHLYESKCIGCGKCEQACPVNAQRVADGVRRFQRAICMGCGRCTAVCYAGALVLSGKEMTTEQVMMEVVQDKAYYSASGGGVTLSGGEVLCQKDFAHSLIRACHNNGISTGIETNLHQPFDYMEPLLREVDILMMDIKLFDDAQHHKWVGVTNHSILENAKKASRLGIPMIVRTPLIPEVTDTKENLTNIAEFVASLPNVLCYELLNFNPLGEAKYKSLGLENPFEMTRPLPTSRLEEIHSMLSKGNVAVRVR